MGREYNRLTREIWAKFRVKRNDSRPFKGWHGTRETLAEFLGEQNFDKGAEIGVASGRYSKSLLQHNPNLHMLCVDPWKGFSRRSTEKVMEKTFRDFLTNLEGYNVTVKKMPSMEAVLEVEDGSLDFVYIDAMHDFDSVMRDLIEWSKKVRSNGIIAGHDYFTAYQFGVIPAVHAYTEAHNISHWYITREHVSSFFWVKP